MGKKGKKGKKGDAAPEEVRLTTGTLIGPTQIVNHMNECVTKFGGVWAPLDESENYHQNHDERIARDSVRPIVQDKIRKEVDVRLLAYLDNIKLKVAARPAAGKKGKKGKGKKGKG